MAASVMSKLLLLSLLTAVLPALSEKSPRFEIVPAKLANTGEGRVRALEQDAGKESFISWAFGTDCYTEALRTIQKECRHLDHEGKTRLALAFANCHLGKLGKRTYPCTARMSLAQCVRNDDSDFFFTHMQFFSEVDSMCLFVQNQGFQRHTEFVLNLLYHAGSASAQRLQSINASLAAHSEALSGVASHLQHVSAKQERVSQSIDEGLTSLGMLHDRASSLDTKMQLSLDHQDKIADRQLAVIMSLGQLEDQERRVLAAATDLHQLAKESATEFVKQQQLQGTLQHEMLADLREVAVSSKGVAAAMQAVAHYQRRSDAVLVHLLGRSYGAADVMFYVAGGAAATAAGAAQWTRAARLPLMALFGTALVAERCLPPRLHRLLHAGDDGQVMLRLPVPTWLPVLRPAAAEAVALNFKWLVRRLCLAAVAAALLYAASTFRNAEQETLRALERIEAYQRQQDAAQEALRREMRAALRKERALLLAGVQAMLDGKAMHAGPRTVHMSQSEGGATHALRWSDDDGSEVTSLPEASVGQRVPKQALQPLQPLIRHGRGQHTLLPPGPSAASKRLPAVRQAPSIPPAAAAATSTHSLENGNECAVMHIDQKSAGPQPPAGAAVRRRKRGAASEASDAPTKVLRTTAALTSAVPTTSASALKRPLQEAAASEPSSSSTQKAKRHHCQAAP